MMVAMPRPRHTVTMLTEGFIVGNLTDMELIFDEHEEPGSMLSAVPHDLEKQVHDGLAADAKLKFNNIPPDGPPHPSFLDGTKVWTGGDGSKWRYSQNANKWRKVAGP